MGARLNDYGKAILLGLIIVATTVLAVAEVIPGDSVERVLTLVLGYLVGNGVAAARGITPSPVIGPAVDDYNQAGASPPHPGGPSE